MQSRKPMPACLQFQQTNACCGRLAKRASSTMPKSADSSPLVSSTNSSTAGGRFPPLKRVPLRVGNKPSRRWTIASTSTHSSHGAVWRRDASFLMAWMYSSTLSCAFCRLSRN
ncbi:uncharacterized protein LOC115628209 [Scaptodrosophila lebanonensis]|uniref:Uncharacterized protein LOC115628209 n=1 Tax=Drosophila lebanonensis TaxID=7225 RepID=A0A6J2TVD6_DROLE|nr:uncharacterized protein LOC115628209 [Scaptodrosophila lebanonensis]